MLAHVKAGNGDHVPEHACAPGPDLSHCATCGNLLDVTVEFVSAARANRGAVATVRRVLAAERVRRAMDKLQAAQTILSEAQQELSAVQHGHPTWKRVGRLHDLVHREWYKTRELLDNARIKIDREPTILELDAFTGRA